MKDVEQLDDGKLLFHSYDALKEYCDDVDNPLDNLILKINIIGLLVYLNIQTVPMNSLLALKTGTYLM